MPVHDEHDAILKITLENVQIGLLSDTLCIYAGSCFAAFR